MVEEFLTDSVISLGTGRVEIAVWEVQGETRKTENGVDEGVAAVERIGVPFCYF